MNAYSRFKQMWQGIARADLDTMILGARLLDEAAHSAGAPATYKH
jgi:hypothetical protein